MPLSRITRIARGTASTLLAFAMLSTPALAQQKKISFLTWNMADQEELFKEWIA